MSNNALLYLPVSLGEAIDKLTILDIKLSKINNDNRKNDVKNEYELLYDKLKEFVIKYNNLYETMKKVNLLIWNMMDILRDGIIIESEYLKTCKECIEFNDIRFRVKNKINYISKSFLKEQKSYKINRLIIIINKEIIDDVLLLNIIKYFSFIYDEIIIESSFSLSYLCDFFYYDISILFKTQVDLNIDYKNKVIIENKEYNNDEIYKLFNITGKEINKIIYDI
jgi:hypothetical protein